MFAVGFLSDNEPICSSPGNELFLCISFTVVLEGPLALTSSLAMCTRRSPHLRVKRTCSSHGGSQWQSSCGETLWSGDHRPIRG